MILVAGKLAVFLSGSIRWHLSFRVVLHDCGASEDRLLEALARAGVADARLVRAYGCQVLLLLPI